MDNKNILDITYSYDEIMIFKEKIESSLKKCWASFVIELFKSLAWIAGGAGVSYFTYCNAKSMGGTYYMFYGAILYGIIRFCKVMALIPEIQEDIEYERRRLWNSIGCFDYSKYYN